MVRFVIIGIVVAVAFTLYALVDAAMTDSTRARGVNKPVWVVIIVLLPVVGGVLWFMIGKGSPRPPTPVAPDDDPRFTGKSMPAADLDARMRDLEKQLRALDDEVFPGEAEAPKNRASEGEAPSGGDNDSSNANPGSNPESSNPESSNPDSPKL